MKRCFLSYLLHIYEEYLIKCEEQYIDTAIYEQVKNITDGKEFIRLLTKQIVKHSSNHHDFYTEYVANLASTEDIKFYVAQECILDPRFDDIIAYLQIGCSSQQKMELAANYWDEMGNGDIDKMHTNMFSETIRAVGIDDNYMKNNLLWQSVESGNLSSIFALNKEYFYEAIGYFAVVEYMVPRRFKSVITGWKRCNLPEKGIAYHCLHLQVDALHAKGWMDNVIIPAFEKDMNLGRKILKGALLRLNSSQRYLNAMYCKLQLVHQDRNQLYGSYNHALEQLPIN